MTYPLDWTCSHCQAVIAYRYLPPQMDGPWPQGGLDGPTRCPVCGLAVDLPAVWRLAVSRYAAARRETPGYRQ